MIKRSSLILILLILSDCLNAQDKKYPSHSDHHDHRNEIGIANSTVYFIDEKQLSYGLHFHYVYNLSHFGFGLGFEKIFDEHKHNSIGFLCNYRPIDNLSLNISPGVSFEDKRKELNFALHFEVLYEFFINNIHLGPVLELAYDKDDYHISTGLHIGIGF